VTTLRIFDERSLSFAKDILIIEGQLRYNTDWAATIKAKLEAAVTTPRTVPLTIKDGAVTRVVRASVVSNRKSRRYDYTGLQTRRPDLYERYVIMVPPKTPHSVTFRSAGWNSRSVEWDRLRYEGWELANEQYAGAHQSDAEEHITKQASRIYQLACAEKSLNAQRLALRKQLAEYLLTGTDEPVKLCLGDGMVLGSFNKPIRGINKKLEGADVDLAPFLSETPVKDYVRWSFPDASAVAKADTEGDEWAD